MFEPRGHRAGSKNGEMAEWLKAHAWKACVPQGTVGSNPTLSAILRFSLVQRSLQSPVLAYMKCALIATEGAAMIRGTCLYATPQVIRKLIGNMVGSHHPLLAWFCNFSHTQQWQLLPGLCEERVGKSTPTSLVCSFAARMWGSDRCPEIGQNISVYSVVAAACTPPVAWRACAREKRGASSSSGRR